MVCFFMRCLAISVALGISGFIAPTLADGVVGPSEWTQFRMNSANNPRYHNDSDMRLDGVFATDNQIRSTPVVVEDSLYLGNHESGDLYSYDIVTQELNWKARAPNWVHSEIIYANNALFVGFGNRHVQSDGTRGTGESGVMSLVPQSGEERWTFDTKGEVMPTPLFFDGTVYATTGDKHLYGLDPETGEERWRLNLGHVVSMSSPNVKNGVMYVGGGAPAPSTFSAIDLSAQKILWQTRFEKIKAGLDDVPPVIHDNLVITTAVELLDKPVSLEETYYRRGAVKTYKQILRRLFGNIINKPPAASRRHVIYAMDIATGEVIWRKNIGSGSQVTNNKSGAPMVYQGKVFVGSPLTRAFYAYDAKTGQKLWSYSSRTNKAPPVADEGKVFFTDTSGVIYALDVDSGELLGAKYVGGKLAPSGPVLINNSVLVGSQDSNAYMLPVERILSSNDVPEPKNKRRDYIIAIYVLPLALFALVCGLIVFAYRWKKRQRA